ncbi:acetylornithine aminotransferase [Desulfuribacillus stibiiarsenatis]|uniref:Acetylornithine aminotransferase n=1 Tax=Desulfuribacillus stibiiarsenatis TaxID=1390249 RepID=A0A1E5L9T2_9FIRM|nr:aspartate aminotransferase family protein [Desulfuribacillus stibiiarsenatis]OEH86784.1 acetylornithine aminotransferase [Desulfuribacillus stibiiarsenatis]
MSLMNTYNRWPIQLERGQGSYVWDTEGKKYLDYTSGIAVNQFGHNFPPLVQAIQAQAEKLIHCSNLFHIPSQQQLADALVQESGYGKVFFSNSGAEANEAAIKLARRYQQKVRGEYRYEIITFEKSFHGRTLTTITATAQPKYQEGFQPLPEGFIYCPLNNLEAVEQAITDKTAAILFELVQGEGGVHIVDPQFLQGLKVLAEKHQLLLIVDEVQTGMGRTGTMFAWQQFDFQPDIFTLAKGLGGGVPIGACVAKETVAEAFVPGTHASTFGGNPLVTAAANAIMNEMKKEETKQQIRTNSEQLTEKLQLLQQDFSDLIVEMRGMGLIRGIQFVDSVPVLDMIAKFREKGLLLVPAGDNTLRLLPPLNTSFDEIEEAFTVIREVLNDLTLVKS